VAQIDYYRPAILNSIRLDRHGVIEADAGTGKTYTIEHLILHLLLSTPSTIEQMLVMTFTEKATAELRKRIRQLIEAVVSASSANDNTLPETSPDGEPRTIDAEGRRRLEAALFSLGRAPIYTIHGFCQRVLTDFAFHSGANFRLAVVDGRSAFHRTFRAELRDVLSVEPAALALLQKWLEQSDEPGNQIESLENLLYDAHKHRYLDSVAQNRSEALATLEQLFDAKQFKSLSPKLRNPGRGKATVAAEALTALIKSARGKSERLFESLREFDLSDLEKAVGKLVAELDRGDELLSAVRQVQCAVSFEARMVDSFLPRISDRLRRDKAENGQLDYDDMLANVWRALDGPRGDALVSTLRTRWHHAVVDEFQDTDDLQWRILHRIFVESGGKNLLHVVGDPKQAIYAFRGADVFSYLKACKELKSVGIEKVPLIKNYRSTADFIDACNLLFNQAAPNPIFSGEICYANPAECGRPKLRALDASGKSIKPVTVFRYSPAEATSIPRMRAVIGPRIAAELRRILFDKNGRIRLTGDGVERIVEAKNVYILTRTRAERDEMGEYLRQAKIPFAFYKEEGLLQTDEAKDILDVLKAIQEPGSRSRQLKAWVTPFFAVPFSRLAGDIEVPGGHPLVEWLFDWRGLAETERFAELFDRLLHQSGLVHREIFLANSKRELINYQHIFEILLEEALQGRLSIAEIIARLESYVAENAQPPGIESNTQRIESDDRAVQVMTVHMSKGLEVDVVFLFGGTWKLPNFSPVASYHEGYERRVAVGRTAKDIVKDRLDAEARYEDERLLYVALTRARARVYLPCLPADSMIRSPNGYYKPLNERLNGLLSERKSAERDRLIEVVNVGQPFQAVGVTDLPPQLKKWVPPEALLRSSAASEPNFGDLRRRHPARITVSYTSLGKSSAQPSDIEPEDFKYEDQSAAETDDLPGGRRVGIFIHEVIERVDLDTLASSLDLASWKALPDVKELITQTMRHHQISDPRWADRAAEIVHNALRSPITIRDGISLGPLCKRQCVREMEFVYPIPEAPHPLFGSGRAGEWRVERGFVKGFVDFVFEHDHLHYFADWKSDHLESYDRASVEAHVKEKYESQAAIYSVGVVRLLQIRTEEDYNRRFGGLLYLFVRGMKADGSGEEGIYFHRPNWAEIARYESELITRTPHAESAS
jgi:exodeoxyribonuclease V beta subunit